MSNAQDQVKVTFNKLVVHDNGDTKVGGGRGELFWSFSVDGALVERTPSNVDKVKDGATIQLGESRIVTKARKPGVFLTISGHLTDKDGGLSGKDETDDFSKTFASIERWGAGDQQVNLRDGKLDATLHYKVEVL